jgi:hypothetical protein
LAVSESKSVWISIKWGIVVVGFGAIVGGMAVAAGWRLRLFFIGSPLPYILINRQGGGELLAKCAEGRACKVKGANDLNH